MTAHYLHIDPFLSPGDAQDMVAIAQSFGEELLAARSRQERRVVDANFG